MEPRKAKIAIIITVVVALLLLAVCLCALLNLGPFSKKTPEPEVQAEETLPPEPSPSPTPTEEPAAAEEPARPSAEDLKGCSNDLYHPKPESYLDSYVQMIARASKGDTVPLQYRPEKWEHYSDLVVRLENNTTVTAIAKENGYTLVLVKEGVAGWIPTYQLDSY